jgi:hypothetical protein
MKIAMTISDVIRASDAKRVKQALSLEELGEVRGGGDAAPVPYDSPQYSEWNEGYNLANDGSNDFWTGFGGLVTSAALPPPLDLAGAAAAGGMMVNGAQQMDRGEAMMDHAQAQYDGSQSQPSGGDMGAGGAGGMGNGGDSDYNGDGDGGGAGY